MKRYCLFIGRFRVSISGRYVWNLGLRLTSSKTFVAASSAKWGTSTIRIWEFLNTYKHRSK